MPSRGGQSDDICEFDARGQDGVVTFVELAPWGVLGFAACTFPLLFFVTAPYGRHLRAGWGPMLNARVGWVVMESPSVFLFAWCWWQSPEFRSPMVLALGALWLTHYVQRTFIFSLLMRGEGKQQPWLTAGLAFGFNLFNASGNASALRARPFDSAFFIGAALFAVGFVINVHADATLRALRGPGEQGYKVPRGGLFERVTCPNYLGEIIEWVGFAIAAQTLASWAFAIFTFANLAPRAVAHHRWYRSTFADYPSARRALIPCLWGAVLLVWR